MPSNLAPSLPYSNAHQFSSFPSSSRLLPPPLLLLLLRLSLLLAFASLEVQAVCPINNGYTAPYDLSASPLLTVKSKVVPSGTFYIQPCGSVPQSTCPYTSNQQTCYFESYSAASLGSSTSAKWSPINNDSTWSQGATSVSNDITDWDDCLSYLGGTSTTLKFVCKKGDDSVSIVQEPATSNTYCVFVFEIDSAIVCAATQSGGGGGGGGLSGGWIFVIIVLVTSTVYLAVGAAYNHYRLGLTGVDLIPNRAFWAEIPGLVRDGCIFSFEKTKVFIYNRTGASFPSKPAASTYETL